MTLDQAPEAKEIARDFEAWMASSNYPEIADIALETLPDGNYKSQLTFAAWQAWQQAARQYSLPRASVDATEEEIATAEQAYSETLFGKRYVENCVIGREARREAMAAAIKAIHTTHPATSGGGAETPAQERDRLQREIGERQSRLHFLVLGDQSIGVHIGSDGCYSMKDGKRIDSGTQ